MRRILRNKILPQKSKSEINTSSTNNILNNGLLIALIPGYAYLLAFAYEYGYCKHFELPVFLISPSLASILIIISVLVLFMISNLKFLGIITPLFRILRNPKYASYYPFIRINTFFLFATLIILFIYSFYWSILLPVLITWIVIDLLYFAPVWFFDRKKKSLQERFDEYNQQEDKLDLLVFISKFINRRIINYSIIAALLVGLSFLLGNGEAYKQERFYVLKNDSTQVLLRTYTDILVCSTINYETQKISKTYVLVNLKTFSELEFEQVKIGRLSIDDNTQQKTDKKIITKPDSINISNKSDSVITKPNLFNK